MKGDWCYFNQSFTKEECKNILDLGLKVEPEKEARLGVNGDYKSDDSVRRSKIRFIYSNWPEYEFLFDKIWKLGIQANREWFNFHITNLSFIQLAEYDASYQGEYKRHQDVFWLNGDNKYHRKLSCIIQLSDPNDYEGGNFEMWVSEQPNKVEIRNQGSVIFLPSFVEHQANPVTKGTRYSIAVWFEGPKWV